MFRRIVLPLALLTLAFGAFVSAAWCLADARDLGGLYFVIVGLVALRAEHRVVLAVTA